MIKKFGTAQWSGGLKDGTGTVSTQSGSVSNQPYGFDKRFGDAAGTNPEELVGAAHASCFSMAFSNILGQADIVPDSIETRSTISLSLDGGAKIVAAHLDVTVKAAGERAKIEEAAKAAETGCPVSQLLNCEITMDLTIV